MNVLAILKDFTLLCKSIFENTTTKMSKRFLNWLVLTIRTVALIPGKINFTRLSRYGGRTAKTFSVNFKTSVEWLSVNMKLAREAFAEKMDDVAIAIDPSFLSKAGKLTYGLGKFWSGVAQRVKRSLEIMAIGAISLSQHSCVMLGAVQTPSSDMRKKDDASMIEWYLSLLATRKDELLSFSKIIVADAFFSVFGFVNEIVKMGFNFVGRLKDNAYLRYLAPQDPAALKKRGRRKMYGDKVDFANPDMSVFTSFTYTDHKGESTECYCAIVRSRALKRNIKIVVFPVKEGKSIVYFSTDLDMEAQRIIGFYRTRFQIEFGIRDAKQFTGLQSSQTRDKDRLDFAFNLSFTTLNICKAVIREHYPDLTVAQFKRLMFESYLASTIISTYGKSPHLKIIQRINQKLTEIAA